MKLYHKRKAVSIFHRCIPHLFHKTDVSGIGIFEQDCLAKGGESGKLLLEIFNAGA